MIILALPLTFLLGALAGAAVLYRVLPARLKRNVDYRERWQAAVGLLGTQGQLSAEQVKTITAPAPVRPAVRRQVQSGGDGSIQIQAGGDVTLSALYHMASWDRADVEIERARQGLPPVDDLYGMATWDAAAVIKARARYGLKREAQEKRDAKETPDA